MQTRIRHIVHKRKGTIVQNEQVLNKAVISIGRATDQDIFLSDLGVAYQHAQLTVAGNGQVGVASLSKAGLHVNGRFSQSGSFKGRGEIQVGPYRITVEPGTAPIDIDITIEQVYDDIVDVQSEHQMARKLEDTWLSRRRAAWTGFVLILLLCLIVPMAGFFNHDTGKLLHKIPVAPDDGLWLSGEISSQHKHFASNCNACHVKPFQKVKNAACLACHKDVTVHADPEIFNIRQLAHASCTDCHQEHKGTAFLVRQDQALCSNCHEHLSKLTETRLADIKDFGKQHVEFRPRLLTDIDPGIGKPVWHRVSLDTPGIKQETGLIFSHKVHLDVNGVDSPTGNRVLNCSSCHQTDASGNYMLPIQMEVHCQECHRLDFDQNAPNRQLPHADLGTMTSMLNEFYAFMALRGNYQDTDFPAPDIVRKRRIPGKTLTPKEMKTAMAWAKDKAADVKEEVIEFRSCNLCHKVMRDPTAEYGWRIPKVHISQRWFSKGEFDHRAHRNSKCEDCHKAKESKSSEDVLLPGIKVCRDCHGGAHSSDKLASTCITCHKFHEPDTLLMGNSDVRANNE